MQEIDHQLQVCDLGKIGHGTHVGNEPEDNQCKHEVGHIVDLEVFALLQEQVAENAIVGYQAEAISA